MQDSTDLSSYITIYRQVIPVKVCEHLTEYTSSMKLHPATIGLVNQLNKNYRDTLVSIFPEDHWIMGIHFHYGAIANNLKWNFDLTGPSPSQFATYQSGCFYNWHSDCPDVPLRDQIQTRKITCILNISAPNSYEGGDFKIRLSSDSDEPKEYCIPDIKEEGSIIVFPSILPHKVTDVTSGERSTVTTWLLGPPLK